MRHASHLPQACLQNCVADSYEFPLDVILSLISILKGSSAAPRSVIPSAARNPGIHSADASPRGSARGSVQSDNPTSAEVPSSQPRLKPSVRPLSGAQLL